MLWKTGKTFLEVVICTTAEYEFSKKSVKWQLFYGNLRWNKFENELPNNEKWMGSPVVPFKKSSNKFWSFGNNGWIFECVKNATDTSKGWSQWSNTISI